MYLMKFQCNKVLNEIEHRVHIYASLKAILKQGLQKVRKESQYRRVLYGSQQSGDRLL